MDRGERLILFRFSSLPFGLAEEVRAEVCYKISSSHTQDAFWPTSYYCSCLLLSDPSGEGRKRTTFSFAIRPFSNYIHAALFSRIHFRHFWKRRHRYKRLHFLSIIFSPLFSAMDFSRYWLLQKILILKMKIQGRLKLSHGMTSRPPNIRISVRRFSSI